MKFLDLISVFAIIVTTWGMISTTDIHDEIICGVFALFNLILFCIGRNEMEDIIKWIGSFVCGVIAISLPVLCGVEFALCNDAALLFLSIMVVALLVGGATVLFYMESNN